MANDFSDKSNTPKPESALAGISDSILQGLTAPVELFTRNDDQKAHKNIAEFRENAKDYLKEGLKTAAMFMRGKTGLITTIATQALDEWKPQDTKHQWVDLGLGAAKGAALTCIFRKTAMVDSTIKFYPSVFNVPMQAAKLGLYSRVPTVGLSRSTWLDENDKFDANRTGNIIAASAGSIVTDVAAGIATHGLLKGANRITGDAVKRSPMLSTVLTGSGFGMSNGAAQEVFRQTEEQKQFNPLQLKYWKIGQSALLQGAIDSIAAIPGGHQAEHEALNFYNKMNAGAPKVAKVPSFTERQAPKSALNSKSQHLEHNDKCCARMTKAQLKNLLIFPSPVESTQAKFSRLQKGSTSRRENEGYDESLREIVSTIDTFIDYTPKDHDLTIAVPKTYDKQLNYVRAERIHYESGAEPTKYSFSPASLYQLAALERFADKALPEDLIPHLDALPNSSLVKLIYLLGEKEPLEIKNGVSELGTAFASADETGQINFYLHDNYASLLRQTTNHEFGHLVHFQFTEAKKAFDSACVLEKALSTSEANARKYALESTDENFAVHFGEELLHPSPKPFMQAIQYAPLRMAVLAKVLKSTLCDIPQAKVSLNREQFLARANFLEEKVITPITERLIKDLPQSTGSIKEELKVLAYLGNAKHAKALINISKNIVDHKDGFDLVDTGVKLCKQDRNKQVTFLLTISNQSDNRLTREHAISKLTREEIQTHLVSNIESIKGQSHNLYLRRLNDLSFWYELNGDHLSAENYSRLAVKVSEAKGNKPSPESFHSLQMLTDQLLHNKNYVEGEQRLRESLDVSKQLYGESSITTKEISERLAKFLYRQGHHQEALRMALESQVGNKNICKTEQHLREAINTSSWEHGKINSITRKNLSALANFLLSEGRQADALPIITGRLEADRLLAQNFGISQFDRLLHAQYVESGLEQLADINESLGRSKEQIYWLQELDKYFDSTFNPLRHRDVVKKLAGLLPTTEWKELHRLYQKLGRLNAIAEALEATEKAHAI